jgi:hypothetical protein
MREDSGERLDPDVSVDRGNSSNPAAFLAKEMPGRFAGQSSPIQDPTNSHNGSAAGDQVDDEHDQRGNQQQVNQAAGYMQTEPE